MLRFLPPSKRTLSTSLRSGAGRDSIGFFGRSATVQWRACRQANESPTGRGSQRRGLSRNRRSRHSNGSDWITPTAGRRSEAKRKPRRGSRTPAGLRTQHREASQRAGPSSQRGERSPVPFPSGWPRAERQSACVGPSQYDTLEVLPTEIGEHYYETSARYRGRRRRTTGCGFVRGIRLGLPRGWRRLQRLRPRPLLRARCQDHRAPHMRAAEPDPDLYDSLVPAGNAVGFSGLLFSGNLLIFLHPKITRFAGNPLLS